MKTKKQNIIKKLIIKLIVKIIIILLIFGIIYNLVYNIWKFLNKDKVFGIFGTKFYIMQDDTMGETIKKNDLVIIKKVKEEKIAKDDVVAYNIKLGLKFVSIKRITKITEKNGIKNYTLRGDRNYLFEPHQFLYKEFDGKVIKIMPKTGRILKFCQSKIITFILIIFIIVLIMYSKYKKRQAKLRKIRMENRNKR